MRRFQRNPGTLSLDFCIYVTILSGLFQKVFLAQLQWKCVFPSLVLSGLSMQKIGILNMHVPHLIHVSSQTVKLLATQFRTLAETQESISSKGKCCYTKLINLVEKVFLMYLFIY